MKHRGAGLGATAAGLALVLAGPAQAQSRSAACIGPAAYLAAGQTQTLTPGTLQRFAIDLGEVERIEITLAGSLTGGDEATLEVCDMS